MRESRHPASDVEGHVPALRRYALGLIGRESPDPAACADEMVRQTVERARRKGQLGAFHDPQIWLYATLTTCNRARSAAQKPRPDPQRPPAPGVAEGLGRLALEDREALLLVVIEGFTYAQAASILGLTRQGVASRVARARQLMAERPQAQPRAVSPLRPRHPPYLRLVK